MLFVRKVPNCCLIISVEVSTETAVSDVGVDGFLVSFFLSVLHQPICFKRKLCFLVFIFLSKLHL